MAELNRRDVQAAQRFWSYTYLIGRNKTSYCLKDLPDCQKDLPREERLTPKNGKNVAKIYEIPRGKGMLPISDIRHSFLTMSRGLLATCDALSRRNNAL